MLYNFLFPLSEQFALLNLFRYITFRSCGALLTGFILTMILIPKVIKKVKALYVKGQPIRTDGPEAHLKKTGTPTMGGIALIFATIFSAFLWGDITNFPLWIVIFVTFSCALLGFTDDFLKVTRYSHQGLSAKAKLLVQIMIGLIAVLWIQYISSPQYNSHLTIPFVKDCLINLGIFYIPFVIIVITGSSNAVNLTDGLDGLAIVPIIIATACFAIIAYVTGSSKFAHYLQLLYVEDTAELTVFCCALIGAGLGFLWYNAQPADIFMGDVGSLACGGAIGVISVLVKQELILAIIGGVFVIEALSVIIQVYYFKFTKGKRFFKMAPIHHHFEKIGWSENKVVIRFWIISVLCAIIGLVTLKIR